MDHLHSSGSRSAEKVTPAHLLAVIVRRELALQRIWKIVHTRTKDTSHRGARDHFMADFDAIRAAVKASGMMDDRSQVDANSAGEVNQ
jgi:hypothetical protein